MSLTKKQKLILKLLLLQQVDKEQIIIKHVLSNKKIKCMKTVLIQKSRRIFQCLNRKTFMARQN